MATGLKQGLVERVLERLELFNLNLNLVRGNGRIGAGLGNRIVVDANGLPIPPPPGSHTVTNG